MNKAYVVTLTVRSGEIEKLTRHLIQDVRNEVTAIEAAICRESHARAPNTPPEGRWYEDLNGEYVYRVCSIVEVDAADLKTLKKYF